MHYDPFNTPLVAAKKSSQRWIALGVLLGLFAAMPATLGWLAWLTVLASGM